ncbi:MAG: cupin domain-containing protein [Thermoplasmata archaeon]
MTSPIESKQSRASEEPLHVMGVTQYVRVTGAETGGAYSVMEHLFPPGGGPAFLHTHPAQETIMIREGTFEFYSKGLRGKETTRGGAGTIHHVASRGPHGLKNVGPAEGRAFIVFHPADLQEKLFYELDALLSQSKGNPDPARRDEVLARHGLVLLERPPGP